MEKEGARRGRLGPGPRRSQPFLLRHPQRHPQPGSRAHPTFTRTCTVPRQFAPSLGTTFEATYRPTDLQTCKQAGNRGDGVLGGRSRTRDTSTLTVAPFFGVSGHRHSLPSPAPEVRRFSLLNGH